MGLLDTLLAGMAGQSTGGAEGGANPMLQILLQMLASGQQGGGMSSGMSGAGMGGMGGLGGLGGLGALIEQFQRAGMGQQVDSWISSGQNMPITADQLSQVFGRGQLQEMAQNSGMDVGQLSGGLAEMLPQLIDQLTPGGQVPPSGLDGALAELSKMMPRG
jgi:uncharacterized protein YidB (DUF937 family)